MLARRKLSVIFIEISFSLSANPAATEIVPKSGLDISNTAPGVNESARLSFNMVCNCLVKEGLAKASGQLLKTIKIKNV
ncbi:Uncharacterised protein [Legionella pneumophila]|nr:Uncharacterised protein [Legionella pneumophila]